MDLLLFKLKKVSWNESSTVKHRLLFYFFPPSAIKKAILPEWDVMMSVNPAEIYFIKLMTMHLDFEKGIEMTEFFKKWNKPFLWLDELIKVKKF